jgi:protein O-mannosyl-transferase
MKKFHKNRKEVLSDGILKKLAFPLAISAIAFITYARAIGFDFVFDDVEHILNNPLIYNFRPSQFWQLFSLPWRAVPHISYALTYSIFGFNSAVFHLFNILIHVLNSVLVFGISRLLAKQWLPQDRVQLFSVAAGMIFAVHPLHSEAVAYVWGRSSSLCALFSFGALLLVLFALAKAGPKKIIYLACAVLAVFLAWKTKEEAITVPFVAAGMVALMGSWRLASGLAFLPFVLIASQWRSLLHLRSVVADNAELVVGGFTPSLNPLPYFLTSIKAAVCYYLKLYVLPVGQSADPYLKPVLGFGDASLLMSIAVLTALIFIGILMHSKRLFVFGLLALLVSPLSSYAVMPLADVIAEHRIYAAGFGFAILTAWLLAHLPRHRYLALAAIVAMLGFLTMLRIEVWANSLTLWRDAASKAPELARPHLNLGMAYQAAGAPDLAMTEYARALSVNPRLAPVYVNMAGVYFDRNDLVESENALRKAMALSPSMPAPYLNLARIAMKKNRPQEALEILNEMPPSASSYLLNLTRGDVFAQLGRNSEAAAEYKEVIRLRSDLHDVAKLAAERLNRLGKSVPPR